MRYLSGPDSHGIRSVVKEMYASTLGSGIRYSVRLSTERTPANANCCFRNKFILVVTYGKVPCFYFLEKALSLH